MTPGRTAPARRNALSPGFPNEPGGSRRSQLRLASSRMYAGVHTGVGSVASAGRAVALRRDWRTRGSMTDLNEPEVPHALPDAFVQLGGVVLGENTVQELLDRVVQLATTTVPAAHSVSISVADHGRVYTGNSSGPDALELDFAQYDDEDGPCLRAIQGTQVEVDLAEGKARWPRLAARAAELGVHKALSSPLPIGDRTLGALNIYSLADRSFSDAEKRTARLFAQQAAVLLSNTFTLMSSVETGEQLRDALESREIIGEAKGILMQQQGCTGDEAFDLLRRASQRENRKLREIAESLVFVVEARARNKGERA